MVRVLPVLPQHGPYPGMDHPDLLLAVHLFILLFPAFEQAEQLFPGLDDISGTQGQHHVLFLQPLDNRRRQTIDIRLQQNIAMAVLLDPLGQRLGGYPLDGRLAGRIYIGDIETVGLMKGGAEFLEKGLRPAVTVRLKEHHQPPRRPGGPHGRKGCPDLRGMMPVIIDYRNSPDLAFDLHPPLDPGKAVESGGDNGEGYLKFQPDGDGGQGIEHIVPARQRQRYFPEQFVLAVDLESRGKSCGHHLPGIDFGLAGQSHR